MVFILSLGFFLVTVAVVMIDEGRLFDHLNFIGLLLVCLVLQSCWGCNRASGENLIRVKILNASEVSDEYLGQVIDSVRARYRDDLGIRLRFSVIKSSKVDHVQFLNLEDRFNEFIAYKKILKPRQYWNRVTYAAVKAKYNDVGCSYGYGLSTYFSLGVMRQYEACSGADRFGSDWVTMAHEVCHAISYNRRRFGFESYCDHNDLKPNIMASDALKYTPFMDLKFLRKTRHEIGL